MQKIYTFAAVLILAATLLIEWVGSEVFSAKLVADDALDHAEMLVAISEDSLATAKSLSEDLATSKRIQLQFELRTNVRNLRQRIENLTLCMKLEQGFLGNVQSVETVDNAFLAANDLAAALDKLAQTSNTKDRKDLFQLIRFTIEPRLKFAMKEIVSIVDDDIERFSRLIWWVRTAGTSTIFLILFSVWYFLILPADRRQKLATTALEDQKMEAVELAAKAEAANEAKTRFLSTMSHELRTPLNGVIGMAELVEPLVKEGEAQEMVRTIKSSGEHLIKIVNEILDFSKVESGSMTVETVPIDVASIVQDVHKMLQVGAVEKAVEFETIIDEKVRSYRMGDGHRIIQILSNLIGNSLKFTEVGKVLVHVSEQEDGAVSIIVKDTGIGMSQEQLAVLFDDFVQADTSIARRFGGTGLGMSITKSLVEAMDGTIHVSSTLGQGTVIEIILPLEVVSEQKLEKPDQQRIEDIPKGLQILAVDDNKTNRMVLSKMLERLAHKVTMCASGQEAVSAAKGQVFDLFLFDISMPEMDGIECLEAINWFQAEVNQSHTPAIAVTANTLPEQVEKYLNCGFDSCLAKPVRAAALKTVISQTIETQKMVA